MIDSDPKTSGGHCGTKPKKFAIGIAPLGTVSIGVVPMGVINLSVVGMGLLAIGVNTMGVWTAGPMSMGLVQIGKSRTDHSGHNHGQPNQHQESDDPRFMAYPTKAEAEAQATAQGCKGAHAMGDFWMPCSEHPTSDQ
jgi:hypothetical protein